MSDKQPVNSEKRTPSTFSVFHSMSRTNSLKKIASRTSSEKTMNRNITIEGNKDTEPPRGLTRTSQIKRINSKATDKKLLETVDDPYELPWDEFLRYQLTLETNKVYLRGPEAIINQRGGRVSTCGATSQPSIESVENIKPKKSESLTQSLRMKGTATAEKIARTLTMRKLKKESRMTVLLSPTGSPRSSTDSPVFEKMSGSRTISLGSLAFHRQRQSIFPEREKTFHHAVVSALDNINNTESSDISYESSTPGEYDVSRSSSTDDSVMANLVHTVK